MAQLDVTLNGKPATLEVGANLVDAVRHLGIDPDRPGIAVALGYDVIPRGAWSTTVLSDGAEVEVVTATQGG